MGSAGVVTSKIAKYMPKKQSWTASNEFPVPSSLITICLQDCFSFPLTRRIATPKLRLTRKICVDNCRSVGPRHIGKTVKLEEGAAWTLAILKFFFQMALFRLCCWCDVPFVCSQLRTTKFHGSVSRRLPHLSHLPATTLTAEAGSRLMEQRSNLTSRLFLWGQIR